MVEMQFSSHAEAQGVSLSLCLSCSHSSLLTPIWNFPLCFSFPLYSHSKGHFLTFYLCALLGKAFLGIILKLCPYHCQTRCCLFQKKKSLGRFPIQSCQPGRQGDSLVFFCSLVSHLTLAPEIYYEICSVYQLLDVAFGIFNSVTPAQEEERM